MDILNLLSNVLRPQPQPQAMTRITHTPVYWAPGPKGVEGGFSPQMNAIVMNPTYNPQDNPNLQNISATLRHESSHALLWNNPQVLQSIASYFKANPGTPQEKRLVQLGYDKGTVGTEAPAYAVEGNYLTGPPSAVDQYTSRMPDSVRKKYLSLMGVQ